MNQSNRENQHADIGAAETDAGKVSLANLPNFLSAVRLVGSPVMAALAVAGAERVVLIFAVILLLTDWVDGKLAILWHQQTTFGARLDSLADATFYGSVLLAMWWLRSEVIGEEIYWILPPLIAYAVSALVGWLKFGRIPTYHTRAAKTSWLLVSIAVLAVFADWSPWPLRIAAVGVLLTNLEAIAITLVLPQSQVDLTSIYHAVLARRRAAEPPEEPGAQSPPTDS
jgi:cardiolipin synthase